MPLATVTTLYSTSPLIGVLLAAILLGERIRRFHWIAILLGFVGAVIAANPAGDVSPVPSLIALGAGLLWATAVVFTRKGGARESSDVQLFTTGIVFMLLSARFTRWQIPSTLFDSALMLALGVQIYLAQLCFFEACRFAPASLVGPLEYSTVIWACLFGILIFSEWPSPPIVLGGLLVIISGVALAVSLRKVSDAKYGAVSTAQTSLPPPVQSP